MADIERRFLHNSCYRMSCVSSIRSVIDIVRSTEYPISNEFRCQRRNFHNHQAWLWPHVQCASFIQKKKGKTQPATCLRYKMCRFWYHYFMSNSILNAAGKKLEIDRYNTNPIIILTTFLWNNNEYQNDNKMEKAFFSDVDFSFPLIERDLLECQNEHHRHNPWVHTQSRVCITVMHLPLRICSVTPAASNTHNMRTCEKFIHFY